jgi:hypothetical protein
MKEVSTYHVATPAVVEAIHCAHWDWVEWVVALHSQADPHSWHYPHMLGRHQNTVGLDRGTLVVADIAHSLGSSDDKVPDTAELKLIETTCSNPKFHHKNWNGMDSHMSYLHQSIVTVCTTCFNNY